ncbi:MAG: hypothetical protein IKT67_05450 [Lachnospiraceae bacterium]|nr:hypothetical protein [Lachnospiraceae bacterium]
MNRYIKAEFELFKRQTGNLIGGGCLLFVFALLLLLSGVGSGMYCVYITLVGYVAYLFFNLAFFLSPASHWINRKKVIITSEQMVLSLGESKRTYVKNKVFFCMVQYLLTVLLIAVMQIPAALIAGDAYSVWGFYLEISVFTALVFMSFFVLFVVPSGAFLIAIPGWTGFCGGFVGSYFGMMSALSKEEAFDSFFWKAIVGIIVGVLSVGYRYLRTIVEERGGLRVRKPVAGEE